MANNKKKLIDGVEAKKGKVSSKKRKRVIKSNFEKEDEDEKGNLHYSSIVFIYAALVFASPEFKVYPGAMTDEKATKEANEAAQAAKMSNVKSTIHTNQILFPKYLCFTKALQRNIQCLVLV